MSGRAEPGPTNGIGGGHDTATGDPTPLEAGSSTVAGASEGRQIGLPAVRD
jgi:hypothetical protein